MKKPLKAAVCTGPAKHLPLFLVWGQLSEGGGGSVHKMTLWLTGGTQPLCDEDASITLLPWKASINTHTQTHTHTGTQQHTYIMVAEKGSRAGPVHQLCHFEFEGAAKASF